MRAREARGAGAGCGGVRPSTPGAASGAAGAGRVLGERAGGLRERVDAAPGALRGGSFYA